MLWDLVEYPETSRVGSGLNININSPQKVAQFLSFASMTLVYVSIMTLVVEVRFCIFLLDICTLQAILESDPDVGNSGILGEENTQQNNWYT